MTHSGRKTKLVITISNANSQIREYKNLGKFIIRNVNFLYKVSQKTKIEGSRLSTLKSVSVFKVMLL